MGFRTYAIAILFATASLVLAVAAFNVVIDPYGLFDLVRVEGVNKITLWPRFAASAIMLRRWTIGAAAWPFA